jgi:hypothetical protein
MTGFSRVLSCAFKRGRVDFRSVIDIKQANFVGARTDFSPSASTVISWSTQTDRKFSPLGWVSLLGLLEKLIVHFRDADT